MLTRDEQHRLLTTARAALEARVRGETPLAVSAGDRPLIASGAFVSIHRHGDLRGCLGRIDGDWPLDELVGALGADVADADPRFPPVAPAELPDIDIEISVLTPAVPVARLEDIEPGRHGLIAEQGGRRGLLLPQVATEHGWDRQALVEHTCRKAGLPADAWLHGAHLSMFEAQVFTERPRPEER